VRQFLRSERRVDESAQPAFRELHCAFRRIASGTADRRRRTGADRRCRIAAW
jgi:hypothetical protein